MKNKIKTAVISDLGKVRQGNEDNFVELQNVFGNSNVVLAGAIDGVGGYAGGARAAEITKLAIEKTVKEAEKEMAQNIELLLRKAFVEANNQIFEERFVNPVYHKMSCVLSVALLDAEKEVLHYVHCGDSRFYIFRNHELIKITKDHSLVGYLEDNGDLLEEDAMKHPRRNEIFKLLGEKELKPDSDYFDTGEFSFNAGDIALFCSDGLTDLVNRASIMETLESSISLEEKCQQLVNKANALGGKDNITVVLAEYRKDPFQKKENTAVKSMIIPTEPKPLPKKKKSKLWLWLLLAILLPVLGILVWFFFFLTEKQQKDYQKQIETYCSSFFADNKPKQNTQKILKK